MTISVDGSSSHHSSRSFEETSALLPIEMNDDRPRPLASARSSTASPRAPLCDEKPMFPAGNARGAKVAFSRTFADAIPRQFGPTRRAPCSRTSAISCSCRIRPSAPISAKPAEMTQIARTPASSASCTAASTCSPGRQTTASSTWSGMSPTFV